MEILLLIVTTVMLILAGLIFPQLNLFKKTNIGIKTKQTKKPKLADPKPRQKPENWYWEKRTDFTGKTYYFPKHREQHSCKCNHHKNHCHDISGQD